MKKKITSAILALLICLTCTVSVFADDSSYSIISPRVSTSGITYCDNLLVSIKVVQNKSIAVTLYNYPKFTDGDSLTSITTDTLSEKNETVPQTLFKSGNQINFFTNEKKGIAPGLYSIKVDVFDSTGSVRTTENNYFIVKGAKQAEKADLFETQPSTTMQFFQNLFRGLFGVVE